jgi:hypothetical protein
LRQRLPAGMAYYALFGSKDEEGGVITVKFIWLSPVRVN